MMQRPDRATTDSLVYQPQWELEDMMSCCAATVPIRLEASYCTPRQQKINLRQLVSAEFSVARVTDTFSYAYALKDILMDAAMAVPLDMIFGSILDDMYHSENSTADLFICTDNITNPANGDVHKGPFSTKNLVQWLVDNDLATVYQGAILYKGARRADGAPILNRTARAVTTWSWVLRPTATQKYITKIRAAFKEHYNALVKDLPGRSDPTGAWAL